MNNMAQNSLEQPYDFGREIGLGRKHKWYLTEAEKLWAEIEIAFNFLPVNEDGTIDPKGRETVYGLVGDWRIALYDKQIRILKQKKNEVDPKREYKENTLTEKEFKKFKTGEDYRQDLIGKIEQKEKKKLEKEYQRKKEGLKKEEENLLKVIDLSKKKLEEVKKAQEIVEKYKKFN